MLEHVALGQSRFVTPGVAPDPRGVLLGRLGLLQFPTLEGVVSWLRLYSAESSLDELLSGLQILRVTTPLKSREMVVRFPSTSSYTMDRAARCAQLVGGSSFTGSGKHFVKYRDERSPYGYDATEIAALPEGAELMLHGEEYQQTYAVEGEVPFEKLLFRLSLRRVPGGARLRDDQRSELLLAVERGLGEGIVRYLWRNRVEAELGLVRPQGQSAFDDFGRARSFLLVRARELEPRILELFLATPGVTVFSPAGTNVAVEVGYRHALDLASCAGAFDSDRFYLFWGERDRVDTVAGPLELSGIEHLTDVELELEKPEQRTSLELGGVDPVGVPLELAPSLSPSRQVVASLVPLEQGAWVKRLVYLLPSASLRGHRVAVTDRGILLVARPDTDVVPLGQLLTELAPGLLVPLGMELVPRVAPDVLARTLGHGSGVFTVFPTEGRPFQIGEASLMPLERRALAEIEVERAEVVELSVEPPEEPSVVNDPVGRFALWGFSAPPEK